MSKEYEIKYFELHGRAEPTRLCLWHAKADWQDTRVTGPAWMELKATLPNGQVPVLVHKGHVLNESMAILRYVGKNLGYYPSDALEAWNVDQTIDFIADFLPHFGPPQMMGGINEESEAKFADCWEKIAAKLDKQLEGKTWLCNDKISIADCTATFVIMSFVWNENMPAGAAWSDKAKAAIAKHPNFAKYCEHVKEEWKEWLESRPKCSL